MLTGKENLREVLKKDGHPDRFVNQYDYLFLLYPDLYYMGDYPLEPGKAGFDQFGVYWSFPEGQMGAFPVHDEEHRVLKDVLDWREIVHKPFIPDDPGYWGMLKGMSMGADRENQFVSALYTQGVFERLHALMGMEDAMANFYLEPEEMHELIDFLTEIELDFAHAMVENVGIEAILHHDDWGSLKSSFLSPEMFDEFITPAYQKIYGYYHEHDVLVVHHNDAYSANLVPSMIKMGIDIWQGPTPTNDIPSLIKEFGGQITFMGEIETKVCDLPDWKPEIIAAEVERACRKCGTHNFIPCLTSGLPGSAFPGVYEAVHDEIERMSKEMF